MEKSPRSSLRDHNIVSSSRSSFREGTGSLHSARNSSGRKSRRCSLREGSVSPKDPSPQKGAPLEPYIFIAPPYMQTLPIPLSWEMAGLSPLVTPQSLTPVSPGASRPGTPATPVTPVTPTTPVSPLITRFISTNWESLGAYDPFRYFHGHRIPIIFVLVVSVCLVNSVCIATLALSNTIMPLTLFHVYPLRPEQPTVIIFKELRKVCYFPFPVHAFLHFLVVVDTGCVK